MKLQVIGKNIEVTDAIRNAITSKIRRMDKYFVINDDVLARAVVCAYKVGAKVEITIFTKEMDLRAEVRNNDLYAAVDLAIDKLEDQMRRLKTRMDRSKGKMLSLGKSFALEELEGEEDEDDVVVRTKTIDLKPMSLDEAIARMDALGHSFFIYLDADDDRVCVVYRRLEGGYGVIEAENRVVE